MSDELQWLLEKIKSIGEWPNSIADHRTIWRGSYDVVSSAQDYIDNVNIPKQIMQEATDLGLIRKELFERKTPLKTYLIDVWKVTEAGDAYLDEHQTKRF